MTSENSRKAQKAEKVKHVPIVDGSRKGATAEDEAEERTSDKDECAATDEQSADTSSEAADEGADVSKTGASQEACEDDAVKAAEEVVEQAASEAAADAHREAQPDPLQKALADANDARDRYMRLQAEWDNYRKRNAAERLAEQSRAAERVVKDILPVVDDFERAIQHAADDPDVSTMLEGIQAVHGKLLAVLAKEKVVPIDPTGEAFDVNRDQAVGTVEDGDVFDETVMQVYQKGYEMAGRIIRPAMVTVSTGGPKRPTMDVEPEAGADAADNK